MTNTRDADGLEAAREVLADAYERSGFRSEAAAFRAGAWTCADHPALRAMLAFATTAHAAGRREALEEAISEVEQVQGLIGPALRRQLVEAIRALMGDDT